MPTSILNAVKPGSRETYYNSAGQLNATSSYDALKVVANLLADIQSGKINTDTAALEPISPEKMQAKRKADTAAFIEASNAGVHSPEFTDIGANLAATVQENMARTGFARNNLMKGTIDVNGGTFRARLKNNANVLAVVSTESGALAPRFITDKVLEGYFQTISENIRVLDKDIHLGNDTLVEDAYTRTQQAFGVREDQIYMSHIRYAAASSGQERTTTSVTKQLLGNMRADLDLANVDSSKMFVGTQIWPQLLSADLQFDPATAYELITTGRIGRLLDMQTYTDGKRDPGLRTMKPNELFVVSSPEYHGAYCDRGPITAVPRDNFDDGQIARGWFMYEYFGTLLANTKSVSLLTLS